MKKLLRGTLQNKLIASFVFIGLVPMVISTLIVVSTNTRMLEKQMERDIREASRKVMEAIEDYQSRAELIANLHTDNPRFMEFLRSGKAPQIIQTGKPLILWIQGETKRDSYGKDVLQLKTPHALIAGTITPIDRENGTHLGELVVGYELGKSFSQEMSLMTDVEVNIGYREEESSSDERSPDSLLLEKALEQGESYYDKNAVLQGAKYQAYYQPLRNRDGRVVGTIFCGVPRRYGFLSTVRTWTFFPFLIGLCGIMAGILGYTMAERISKPIRLFSSGVQAVAEGNLDQEIRITSSEELSGLSSAFNHMIEKLRELRKIEEELRRKDRLAALGELSAGVAHEIRNPLGIIRSSAQMLERNVGGNEKAKELISFVIGEVDRLNRVVSNLLDFAKPEKMDLEETRIEDVVEKSLQLAEPRFSGKDIEIVRDYSNEVPRIKVDAGLISQAFLNLILNAIEAMPDGGKLTVRVDYAENLKPRRNDVEVSFTDTGIGIPEDNLPKIFNPFFSTKDEGSGLGLAIVHKVVEAHNANISVGSKVNQGSTFTIRLPLNP